MEIRSKTDGNPGELESEDTGTSGRSKLKRPRRDCDKQVLQKKLKRKLTRDLHYALDPLVPVFMRAPLAEKGCLPSKRTFLQLQDDTIEHLTRLKAEWNTGSTTSTRNAAQGEGKKGCSETLGDLFALGMLSSSQLLLLEVEVSGFIVHRMSAGLQAYFRHHPRDRSIIGECLLHYVDLPSATKLRSAAKNADTAKSTRTPDRTLGMHICLRTFRHVGSVAPVAFSVKRFGARMPGTCELWMLELDKG